jgi:hypothetical protein
MTCKAVLLSDDSLAPAGFTFSDSAYDPAAVMAEAPLALPILWLALFDPAAVRTAPDGKTEIPSLVASLPAAADRLQRNRAVILGAFPEFAPTCDTFAAALGRLRTRYVKIGMYELWEEAVQLRELRAALGWFTAPDELGFAALLELACISRYDRGRRTFVGVGRGAPRAFHLRGYCSREEYWDNEADI